MSKPMRFVTSDNGGYLSDALGDVYTFGDVPNDGSMAGTHLNGSIIAGKRLLSPRLQPLAG
jgi:hypothetical protein